MARIEADWLTAPGVTAVMDALGEGYFVGGCVRNALLDAPVSDIDIATPLMPRTVIDRLAAAGLKSVPTGIDHGTVTAVVDGEGIEVTTFRADVETDGRRAVVSFTTDMSRDAMRRDFTMNALYADRDGRVIDPLGGLGDLLARRVAFVGEAETRIREDYLRILRFFRFHAWYGADGLDPDGLAACAGLADGLDRLARERIGHEMRKLLAAPAPAEAVASMAVTGILRHCLPGAVPDLLAPLAHAEGLAGVAPDWAVRLAAIGGENPATALRLSRREASRQDRIAAALQDTGPTAVLAYRHGADATQAALLLRAAMSGSPPDLEADAIARGAGATLPVSAGDLIAAGLKPGPEIGRRLARAEAAWIDSEFSLDKAALLGDILD